MLTRAGVGPITPDLLPDLGVEPRSADFDGRLLLLGAGVPTSGEAGQRLKVTAVFKVLETIKAPTLKLFVHGVVPGGKLPLVQADHRLGISEPMVSWRAGDVLVDSFTVLLPKASPSDRLDLRIGFYEGNTRWTVDAGQHDGENRVSLGTIEIAGAPPAFPSVRAKKRQGAIVIDGVLDEPDWQRAEILGPFVSYDGRRQITNTTLARMFWDQDALYLAFTCTDTDIHTPYKKRDDPLYNSEAVEIFIDADGDQDVYVELQAAPNDLHFDAAFKGGSRQGFDTSYNHDYETKTKIDGTLNQPGDRDRQWVSEWRIPVVGLKDIPHPPSVGDAWKINLFRLDRLRKNGRVRGSEASAWSSPYSGDFHNLNRFGTLHFVP